MSKANQAVDIILRNGRSAVDLPEEEVKDRQEQTPCIGVIPGYRRILIVGMITVCFSRDQLEEILLRCETQREKQTSDLFLFSITFLRLSPFPFLPSLSLALSSIVTQYQINK